MGAPTGYLNHVTRNRDHHWLLPLVSRHRLRRPVRYFALSFLFPYLALLIMNEEEKHDFHHRKSRTSRPYKGKCKRRSIATTAANAGRARPNATRLQALRARLNQARLVLLVTLSALYAHRRRSCSLPRQGDSRQWERFKRSYLRSQRSE